MLTRQIVFALLVALTLSMATPAREASRRAFDEFGARAQQPRVGATGLFSASKARRGGALQGAVVLEIPDGLHINSDKPRGEFLIPTVVKVTAPRGVRVGPVRYPRANLRRFDFSPDEPMSVFEGFPAVLFDLTVPAAFKDDKLELTAEVSYQMCSDVMCYPPATREVKFSIDVADAREKTEQINSQVFGKKKKG